MTYSASLDPFTKATTVLVTLLFILIGSFQFYTPQHTFTIVLPFLLLAIYILVFIFRPLRYEITEGHVIVHRLISTVKIPISTITHAQYLERKALGFVWRTFGVGGLFGYVGSFSSSKFGGITFYATRRNRLVILKASTKLYALTPDEPDKFVADLKQGL